MAADSQNNGSQNALGGTETMAEPLANNVLKIPKSHLGRIPEVAKMNGSRIQKSHLPELRRRPKMNAGRIQKSALRELAQMPKMNRSELQNLTSEESGNCRK